MEDSPDQSPKVVKGSVWVLLLQKRLGPLGQKEEWGPSPPGTSVYCPLSWPRKGPWSCGLALQHSP